MLLSILYEDDAFIAVNKPANVLVHRTWLSEDKVFVLQMLRDQTGQHVYPIHRLDRGTSGVLIFGKTSETASALGHIFQDKSVQKVYWAVVRGFVPDQETIDYALADKETNQPSRYATARYSWTEVRPETGRRQQIRKHFAHIFHPVVGDKRHGDVKHNAHWYETLGIRRLLLHARCLAFQHPHTHQPVSIEAPLDEDFTRAMALLGFEHPSMHP
jgi:tRNA pseudouridine65 synthase